MLFQKQNNPPKLFTKLDNNTSLFSKQTVTQNHHVHHQSKHEEEKYRNNLELSSRRNLKNI